MIPFLDLKKINHCFEAEFQKAFKEVLSSGWYIKGREHNAFEKSLWIIVGVNML